MPKELSINIPGYTIHYKAWGDPNNPPILALHGWLDNANSFDWLAQKLEDKFYVIAIDLPGHGLSSHISPGSHYHFIDGIFTINNIIKALGYKRIHLMGHSMGACLASLVAGIAPQHIDLLILIEGLGPFSHPEETARTQLNDYLNHQIPHNQKPLRGYPDLLSAAEARAKRGHVSLNIAKQLCHRGLEEKEGQYYWRHDRRLLVPSPLRLTEKQVLSILNNISNKTCLIWASEGFSFLAEAMKERANQISSLQVFELDGGHHIHMEKPEKLKSILLEFF